MLVNLKDKYFVGSRGFYGTNSVKYQGIEMEVTKYNHDYAHPVTNFDWGKNDKASKLLAYAILNTIATPTIARIYANRYTEDVIEHIHDDEWRIAASDVARWINNNTDYHIEFDKASKKTTQPPKEIELLNEEKIQTTSQSENIVDVIAKELGVKYETLAKILDLPLETVKTWRLENDMPKLARKAIEFYKAGISFKEQSAKRKTEIQNLQEEMLKKEQKYRVMKEDIKKYQHIINTLNIPALYKSYKEL